MERASFTVFAGSSVVAGGTRDEVVPILRELHDTGESNVLVFDNSTGEQIDLDVRAVAPSVEAEPAHPRPGRPKLGVVAREVTLLPRHWEWLNAQPGGASVTLRKLVEVARKENAESDRTRRSQEAAFRFMTAVAGNEPGFEEATRALFASDRDTFETCVAGWPSDVADYARRLAAEAFGSGQ